jgi:hypothetical protein
MCCKHELGLLGISETAASQILLLLQGHQCVPLYMGNLQLLRIGTAEMYQN